ncbi:hypothetical protein EPN52_13760 [bacterium]|nr:MAG: hypothetical protein EPN52_13760 [bacterium]
MALALAPTAVSALTHVPEKSAGEAGGLFNFSHNMGRAASLGAFGAMLRLGSAGSYTYLQTNTPLMKVATGFGLVLLLLAMLGLRSGVATE